MRSSCSRKLLSWWGKPISYINPSPNNKAAVRLSDGSNNGPYMKKGRRKLHDEANCMKRLVSDVAAHGYELCVGSESMCDSSELRITLEKGLSDRLQLFVLAHEYGHAVNNHNAALEEIANIFQRGDNKKFSPDHIQNRATFASEIAAWKIGSAYVPERLEQAYWDYARMCLKTYTYKRLKYNPYNLTEV